MMPSLLPAPVRLAARFLLAAWFAFLHASWLGCLPRLHPQQQTNTWSPLPSAWQHGGGGGAAASVGIGRAPADGVANRFARAAGALLQKAGRAQDTEQVGAWSQLAWHYNKVAVDQAGQHDAGGSQHRLAASRAIDTAASTWPYWLPWPETQGMIMAVLGPQTASPGIDDVRLRFTAQRWHGWWREEQPGCSSTSLAATALLPEPRVLAPFSSLIMLWKIHEPSALDPLLSTYDAATAGHCSASSALEEGDLALLTWRVSFSFNLHGEWEDTSSLLLTPAIKTDDQDNMHSLTPIRTPDFHLQAAPWTAAMLQEKVNAAVAASSLVLVPAGDYIFANASLVVSGARRGFGLRPLDGPVKLWFDIKHGLVVEGSEDIAIAGPIEIDYTSGAYYQGTIVSLKNGPPSPPPPARAGHRCFRRSNLARTKCVNSSREDTFVRISSTNQWVKWASTNCFTGHGAINLLPEPFSKSMSLDGCKAACAQDSVCTGIVVDTPSPAAVTAAQSAIVETDFGFLNPDDYCDRYCNAPWSEHTLGPIHWSTSSKFRSGDRNDVKGPTAKLGARTFSFEIGATAVIGDKVFIGIRGGVTLHTHNSSNVSYFGIRIIGASFMAITEFGGLGGHTYDTVSVAVRDVSADPNSTACAGGRRLCDGILASNADCFHSSGCARGPKLFNVNLSSTFDDYLNIHTRTQVIASISRDRRHVQILDPRLNRDKGLPNDHPYGTTETFQNVKPGSVLEIYALNTLVPLANASVVTSLRMTDVTQATGLATAMNEATKKLFHPGKMLPIDVCGLPSEPGCKLRAWSVVLSDALPAGVMPWSLVHIQGWDARGAVLRNNRYYDGFDGIRFKSSNAVISENDFREVRYLEVTPLQHYLEGTLSISNVTIASNNMDSHIVAVCKGTNQQHPTPVACKGIVIETEDDELL